MIVIAETKFSQLQPPNYKVSNKCKHKSNFTHDIIVTNIIKIIRHTIAQSPTLYIHIKSLLL